MTDVDWKGFARDFSMWIGDTNFRITRYTNHWTLIPDGKWAVCSREHYVYFSHRYVEEGRWEWTYKTYTPFDTPDDALKAARATIRQQAEVGKDIRARIEADHEARKAKQ